MSTAYRNGRTHFIETMQHMHSTKPLDKPAASTHEQQGESCKTCKHNKLSKCIPKNKLIKPYNICKDWRPPL